MTHQPVAGFGREKRPGDVGSPSPPPQVVQAPMTATPDSDGGSKEVPESNDRGPKRGQLRLELEQFEVEENDWAVYPEVGPDPPTFVWLDLIGNVGEWSVELSPDQAEAIAEALTNAAEECEDA